MLILAIVGSVFLLHLHVDFDVRKCAWNIPILEFRNLQVEEFSHIYLLVVICCHVGGGIVPGVSACQHVPTLNVGVPLGLKGFCVSFNKSIASDFMPVLQILHLIC